MDTQTIDTIALIRQIRDKHYQCLHGKTHAERIAFYREQAEKMQMRIVHLWATETSLPSTQVQNSVVSR